MNVGIVGVGLIGGSLALAIRRARPGDRILICDTDEATLDRARMLGITDGTLDRGALGDLDLLLIALYPAACIEWLRENAEWIARGALVLDCAGIKREICAVGAALAEKHGFRFIGGHPMAGREVWGISAASPDLFSGASMILTPPQDVDAEVLATLKSWFLGIGFGAVTVRTPEDHDRIIAYTSQLAHILSSAYIRSSTAEEHRGLSAGSFRDMTRVAAINAEMWSEIFLSNSDFLLAELDTLIGGLSAFRETVAAKDRAGLIGLLKEGAARKAACDGNA